MIKDEEDIYQEEIDYFLTDEECERHEDYEDFELEELSFWDNEPIINDRIDEEDIYGN